MGFGENSAGIVCGILQSHGFVLFTPFLFFEHGVVQVSRDGFGDCFVGEFGSLIVLCHLN
jgi:hypothetical protein